MRRLFALPGVGSCAAWVNDGGVLFRLWRGRAAQYRFVARRRGNRTQQTLNLDPAVRSTSLQFMKHCGICSIGVFQRLFLYVIWSSLLATNLDKRRQKGRKSEGQQISSFVVVCQTRSGQGSAKLVGRIGYRQTVQNTGPPTAETCCSLNVVQKLITIGSDFLS